MTKGLLYQLLLVSVFCVACAIAALDPKVAIMFLLTAGFVTTAPYFFYTFVVNFLGGHLFMGCLFVIGLFIPVINIFLLIYMVLAMFSKFFDMMKAAPLLMIGVLFAAGVLFGPAYLSDHWLGPVASGGEAWRAATYAVAGLLAMVAVMVVARAMRFDATLAAALVVGFTAYGLVTIIGFFMPGGISAEDVGSHTA